MSHFSVGVLTNEYPSNDVLTRVLQPYHEFECTGTNDQYVVTIDETEAKRAEFEQTTEKMYVNPNGTMFSKYDNQFYREPTFEEMEKIGPWGGMGFDGGISYVSRDWDDGRGYRAKIHYCPDGWTELEVPVRKLYTFLEWVKDDTGRPIVPFGQLPNINDKYMWGWISTDARDCVTGVYRRTNPNKKWDWWTIGGYYSDRLILLNDGTGDCAQLRDINWGAMELQRRQWREENWEAAVKDPQMAKFLYDIDLETMDKEGFIEKDTGFQLFAYVLDGKWVEKGKMGWWAMVANEQGQEWYDNLNTMLDNLDSRMYLTIVDCHI